MPPKSTAPHAPAMPGIDPNAVGRFVKTAPSLRRTLALPTGSELELLLRAEMQRVIAKLAVTFDEAARADDQRARAEMYRAAAMVAADLAAVAAAAIARSGH